MGNLPPDKAARRIRRATTEQQGPVYFPAIKEEFSLDEHRVALDLGEQRDFYRFAQQLDEEMIGVSRIHFKETRPKKVVGGMNTSYYCFDEKGNRKIAHVWFYSKGDNEQFTWMIRGHEEGHVLDFAKRNLEPVERKLNIRLRRKYHDAIPFGLSRYAARLRGEIAPEDPNLDTQDNFVIPFDIKGRGRSEHRILRSSVFAAGANVTRKRARNKIGEHVKEILNFIDNKRYDSTTTDQLRSIAIYHDLGKQVTYTTDLPGKEHGNISAVIARDYGVSEDIARVIEVHDYPFYLFRRYSGSLNKLKRAKESELVKNLQGVNLDLLVKFAEADEDGRDLQALRWFESNLSKLV